jgi:hypothetical protein
LKELHEENNKFPELKVFYNSYAYDNKKKEYKFLGYHCTKCNRIIKNARIVERHFENCKYINDPKVYDSNKIDEETIVLTKEGKPWRSFKNFPSNPENNTD